MFRFYQASYLFNSNLIHYLLLYIRYHVDSSFFVLKLVNYLAHPLSLAHSGSNYRQVEALSLVRISLAIYIYVFMHFL